MLVLFLLAFLLAGTPAKKLPNFKVHLIDSYIIHEEELIRVYPEKDFIFSDSDELDIKKSGSFIRIKRKKYTIQYLD